MKKKLIKIFSLILTVVVSFGSIVYADGFSVSLDSSNNSIEQIEYQTSDGADFGGTVNVLAEIGSLYKVTIPKVIVLSGMTKQAGYYVEVNGDLAPYETVYVVPESTVDLHTNNKLLQVGTISQDRTSWTYSVLGTKANGLVKADGLSAGKWSGVFWFNISLDKVMGDVINPVHVCADFDLLSSSDADCVNPSTEEYRCKECKRIKTTHNIAALGHDWNEGVCLRCGDTLPDLVVTANGYNGTYDGIGRCITVASNGEKVEYSTDNKVFSTNNPVYEDAGTYTTYYKVSKKGYKTITGSEDIIISKAVGSLTKPVAKTVTYNATVQELVEPGISKTGTVYYKIDDGQYSTSVPALKDAGDYTIYFKVVGDKNHYDVEEQSINVTVINAPEPISEEAFDKSPEAASTWEKVTVFDQNDLTAEQIMAQWDMYPNPNGYTVNNEYLCNVVNAANNDLPYGPRPGYFQAFVFQGSYGEENKDISADIIPHGCKGAVGLIASYNPKTDIAYIVGVMSSPAGVDYNVTYGSKIILVKEKNFSKMVGKSGFSSNYSIGYPVGSSLSGPGGGVSGYNSNVTVLTSVPYADAGIPYFKAYQKLSDKTKAFAFRVTVDDGYVSVYGPSNEAVIHYYVGDELNDGGCGIYTECNGAFLNIKVTTKTTKTELVNGLCINPNGGTYNDYDKTRLYSGVAGTSMHLKTPVRKGYTFLGWVKEDSFTGELIDDVYTFPNTASIDVIVAKWIRNM